MGQPKALLDCDAASCFLERILGQYAALAVPSVVVLGAHRERIQARVNLASVRRVFNPRIEDGPLSSLRRGLREVPEECSGVIVHPVDHPLVALSTLQVLITEHSGSGVEESSILVPESAGQPGHPTLFPAWAFVSLREGPLEAGARWVLERWPDRVRRVPVDDPGVLRNIDSPEDYQAWVSPGDREGKRSGEG
jgi:molybdenum cofactor cytidylyltransferase